MPTSPTLRRYWSMNLRLTGWLLVLWFIAGFAFIYWGRALSVSFFGWPLSFWMAAQGSLIVFVFIVAFYAWRAHRLDVEHGVDEEAL